MLIVADEMIQEEPIKNGVSKEDFILWIEGENPQ